MPKVFAGSATAAAPAPRLQSTHRQLWRYLGKKYVCDFAGFGIDFGKHRTSIPFTGRPISVLTGFSQSTTGETDSRKKTCEKAD